MKLRKATIDIATETEVVSEDITDTVMIAGTIRRMAELRGWDVQAVTDHLDSGKTLYVRSEPFIYQLRIVH